jgi:hypothetical protein
VSTAPPRQWIWPAPGRANYFVPGLEECTCQMFADEARCAHDHHYHDVASG